MLDGTRALLCQLCVGTVCLLKPRMVLSKNDACKNDKNREVGKSGTLVLNFLKLKPETLHP